MDSLYDCGMFPAHRSSVTTYVSSSAIVGAIIFSTLFGMLSGPGAFLFGNFCMTFLTSSGVMIVGIWMVAVCCWLFLISLRSASPSPGKNLSANIQALFSLSYIASSCLFHLSAGMCATLIPGACLLHLDIRQSPLLFIPSLIVNSFRNLLQDALLPHFSSFLSRFFRAFIDCLRCAAGERR